MIAASERAGSALKVFVVEGLASAQLPLRLLNFFAQQDILPDAVTMARSPTGIAMRIVEGTLDDHRAAIILAKMRALPDVTTATLDGAPMPPLGPDG